MARFHRSTREGALALNAYARTVTGRVIAPVARGLARAGLSADALTVAGLAVTLAGVGVVLTGAQRAGAVVIALGSLTDVLDGAVARERGTTSRLGAFHDSVADRVSDAALLGAVAWLVRDDAGLLALAVVALGGAQLTSYIRAKAEALGWQATVGVLERAERVIILVLALFFDLLVIALWLLALGSLVTVAQRLRVVRRQGRASSGRAEGP